MEIQPGLAPGATGLPSTVMEKQLGPDPASCTPSRVNGWLTATHGGTDGSQTAQSVDPVLGRMQTLPWSMVVKDGRRLKQVRLKQVPENPAHRSLTPRTVKNSSDVCEKEIWHNRD